MAARRQKSFCEIKSSWDKSHCIFIDFLLLSSLYFPHCIPLCASNRSVVVADARFEGVRELQGQGQLKSFFSRIDFSLSNFKVENFTTILTLNIFWWIKILYFSVQTPLSNCWLKVQRQNCISECFSYCRWRNNMIALSDLFSFYYSWNENFFNVIPSRC